MGEYAMVMGKATKLGTCEDLDYIRSDQREFLRHDRKIAGNLPASGYLKPENGFRFRFPFPDEDQVEPGEFRQAGRGWLIDTPLDSGWLVGEHRPICQRIECENDANRRREYAWSLKLPCPASPAFKALQMEPYEMPPESLPIEIVQHKPMVGGETWTVVRCGYCGSIWRLPVEAAVALVEHIRRVHIPVEEALRRMSDRDYKESVDCADQWQKICLRILGGYGSAAQQQLGSGQGV